MTLKIHALEKKSNWLLDKDNENHLEAGSETALHSVPDEN